MQLWYTYDALFFLGMGRFVPGGYGMWTLLCVFFLRVCFKHHLSCDANEPASCDGNEVVDNIFRYVDPNNELRARSSSVTIRHGTVRACVRAFKRSYW